MWAPASRGRYFYLPKREGHDGKHHACHICGRPLTEKMTVALTSNQRRICYRTDCHQKVFDEGMKNARRAGWEKPMAMPVTWGT